MFRVLKYFVEIKNKNKELFLFKMDFEKAYDSVDQNCLLLVMSKMKFPWKGIRWISQCICSATTLVLVNGIPMNEF